MTPRTRLLLAGHTPLPLGKIEEQNISDRKGISTMTPEEFRQAGHQLIDWIADYRGHTQRECAINQLEKHNFSPKSELTQVTV